MLNANFEVSPELAAAIQELAAPVLSAFDAPDNSRETINLNPKKINSATKRQEFRAAASKHP